MQDVAKGSITSKTYFLRTVLLKNICRSSLLPNKILQIEEDCTAKTAAEYMFQELPSATEISQCSERICETNFQRIIPVIPITSSTASIKNLQSSIEHYLKSRKSVCNKYVGLAPCKGFNEVTYKINKKLIIIEIMN